MCSDGKIGLCEGRNVNRDAATIASASLGHLCNGSSFLSQLFCATVPFLFQYNLNHEGGLQRWAGIGTKSLYVHLGVSIGVRLGYSLKMSLPPILIGSGRVCDLLPTMLVT